MASREEAAEADALSSQSADSHNPELEADMQKGLVRNSMRNFEESNKKTSAAAAAAARVRGKVGDDRKTRWAALLSKRPSTKDGDSMSNWLMEVLAVSDLDTPLKPIAGGAVPGAKPSVPPPRVGAAAPPARAESPHSDGSEDSPRGAGGAAKKQGESDPVDKFDGGVIKKKRNADFLSRKRKPEGEGSGEKSPSRPFAGGSFAEWKERKKQRKQSKNWKEGTQDEQA